MPMPSTHAELFHVVFEDRRRLAIASTKSMLTMAVETIVFEYSSGSGISYFRTPSQSIMISASSPIGPIAFLSKP